MRVLVTGSAGTIGQHLITHLGDKHEFRGFDIKPTPQIDDFVVASVDDWEAVNHATKGVDAGESDGVFAADGPAEFATRVIELLESSEKASQLGAEARRRVEDAYVWEKQVAHLEGLLEAVCSRQPPRAARGDCP